MFEQYCAEAEHVGCQGGCKTPNLAKIDLFNVVERSRLFDECDSDVFHSVVQKLLFISKRASPDMEMSTSFLCTRVLEPTHKNKVKLTRPIGTNSFSVLITWMDASYADCSGSRIDWW